MSASAKSDTPRTDADCEAVKKLFKDATGVDVEVKTINGEFVVTDPLGEEYKTGLVRKQ
jgi:flagellar hook assembly protein FlgD